jgi:hypothetical protein
MKISEATSYPHPVLAPWSEDIKWRPLDTQIHVREDEEGQQVDILCSTSLDHPQLVDLVISGAASFGCFITCRDTGFRRLQPFGFPQGSHQFAPGALLGTIRLRPMIWAVRPVPGYAPLGAHPEFGGRSDIDPGQILALDDEHRIEVLRPPISTIESIFEIYASDELGDAAFQVDTDGDRIRVGMSRETYWLVQNLRQHHHTTLSVTMNSLYVPVVMEVLHQMSSGTDQFDGLRWFEPFRKRCEQLDIDLENPSLLADAQKLLDVPFSGLRTLIADEESDAND